jgi:hypothetical protein
MEASVLVRKILQSSGYSVTVIDRRDLESQHTVDLVSLFSRKVFQCLVQYPGPRIDQGVPVLLQLLYALPRTSKTASSACASLRVSSRSWSFQPSSSNVMNPPLAGSGRLILGGCTPPASSPTPPLPRLPHGARPIAPAQSVRSVRPLSFLAHQTAWTVGRG